MSDEDAFVWDEPPPLPTPAYDWSAIAAKTKANPMKYLRVFEKDKSSTARAVRQGSIAALRREKGFEVRTANHQTHDDGSRTCTLWVRWNPEKVESE